MTSVNSVPNSGVSYRLKGPDGEVALTGELLIGRAGDCALKLHGGLVSRHHARVRVTPHGVMIEDLGSRNGVMVNGERITGPQQLGHGDVIRIGVHELEFVDERIVHYAPHLSTLPPTSMPYEQSDADDSEQVTTAGDLGALSPREHEVLEMLVMGHTQREIAARLCISPKTVETHRRRIGEKLGCRTRAELVSYAITAGILAPRR